MATGSGTGTPVAATTAATMVAAIETALAANPIGTVRVTIDGQTVEWDRKQALNELKFWEARVAREAFTRPRAAGLNLSTQPG